MTHETTYKFISPEQTLEDWKAGKIQCENLGNEDNAKKIRILCGEPASGCSNYYYMTREKGYAVSTKKLPNLPSIPTDELYAMIKGEGKYAEAKPQPPQEAGELLGYELNGKVNKSQVRYFLNSYGNICWDGNILKDKHAIQRASELGILSTCFKPVYKEREVEVILGTKEEGGELTATIDENESVNFSRPLLSMHITDLQKILEAHKKL